MATQNTNPTDNIFSGLKVVDFASFVLVPERRDSIRLRCDVIKVEPPKGECGESGTNFAATAIQVSLHVH